MSVHYTLKDQEREGEALRSFQRTIPGDVFDPHNPLGIGPTSRAVSRVQIASVVASLDVLTAGILVMPSRGNGNIGETLNRPNWATNSAHAEHTIPSVPFKMNGLGGGLGRTRICDLYRVKVAL